MIRLEAGLSVEGSARWRGPAADVYRQRERALGGRPAKGPWPRPARDRLAAVVNAYKAGAFARYISSRPEFEHVRTRHRSPRTNGVIERWKQSLKYEHLYPHEIDDGPALAEHVLDYARLYNDELPTKRSGGACRVTATPPTPMTTCRSPHTIIDPIRLSSLTRDRLRWTSKR